VGSAVEYRPLSSRQKAELRGYVAAGTAVGRAVLFLLAVGAFAFVLRAILRGLAAFWPPLVHPIAWAVPAAILAVLLYRRSRRWTGGREFRAQVRRDLASGELAFRRVDVVEAIAFEEAGDSGPCYVLLTSDGRTLLFDGQYLETHRRKGFPWTSFEIREAPESRVFFGLHRIGERLAPSACLPAMSFEERKALGSFDRSYQEIDVDFEALKMKGR
jgi:hypothetical protein